MFLAKLVMIHGDELIERTTVINVTSSLIQLYRSSPVGKWHLVKLMSNGLEKMVKTMSTTMMPLPDQVQHNTMTFNTSPQGFHDLGGLGLTDNASFDMDPNFLLGDYSLGATQLMSLSNGPTAFDTSDHSPNYL